MWAMLIFLAVFSFSNSLTTTFDLRGVINGNQMAGAPLGISLGTGEIDVEGVCSQSGATCQNCSLMVRCVPLPMGWLKVPQEECMEGTTCNAHLGRCFPDPVPECDVVTRKFRHTCEQVGIFPDAHDCRKFHLCSPPEGLPDGRPADHRVAMCPRHYGYNPHTAQCSVILENGQCKERPAPPCTATGQNGVLPGSTNHYYVCLLKNGALHPQIFICPHGWHFFNGFCRPQLPETIRPNRPVDGTSPQEHSSLEDHSSPEDHSSSESHASTEGDSSSEEQVLLETSTDKPQSWMEGLFVTQKTTTYKADTFLADKFDLSKYEVNTDEQVPNNDEFTNSFEQDFWQ